MKVYQLTFMDAERGKIVRWKRSKRECSRFVKRWEREYPLRKLLLNEPVEIPTDKTALIEWLNSNVGGSG